MLHLCAVLLVPPHMCRGSLVLLRIPRVLPVLLHIRAVLLILHVFVGSAIRLRDSVGSASHLERFCWFCLALRAVWPVLLAPWLMDARFCWFCILHMVPIVLVLLFCFAFRTLLVGLLRISRCSLDSSPHASALGTIGALLAREPGVSRRWIYDYTSGSVSLCFFIVF